MFRHAQIGAVAQAGRRSGRDEHRDLHPFDAPDGQGRRPQVAVHRARAGEAAPGGIAGVDDAEIDGTGGQRVRHVQPPGVGGGARVGDIKPVGADGSAECRYAEIQGLPHLQVRPRSIGVAAVRVVAQRVPRLVHARAVQHACAGGNAGDPKCQQQRLGRSRSERLDRGGGAAHRRAGAAHLRTVPAYGPSRRGHEGGVGRRRVHHVQEPGERGRADIAHRDGVRAELGSRHCRIRCALGVVLGDLEIGRARPPRRRQPSGRRGPSARGRGPSGPAVFDDGALVGPADGLLALAVAGDLHVAHVSGTSAVSEFAVVIHEPGRPWRHVAWPHERHVVALQTVDDGFTRSGKRGVVPQGIAGAPQNAFAGQTDAA